MFSKHILVALIGVAILSSCSRPIAYFQPAPRERFQSPETVVNRIEATGQPTVAVDPAVVTPSASAVAEQEVDQAKRAMSQIETYVRNDEKLASNKKLTKRMAHINELLATANVQKNLASHDASSKKVSLMKRVMLRKVNQKIKNHLAPDETNVMNRNLKNGIIIGAIGLILSLIFSGVIGVIGLILLIVGIVLILLGVLET